MLSLLSLAPSSWAAGSGLLMVPSPVPIMAAPRIRPLRCVADDADDDDSPFDLGLLKMPQITTPQRQSYQRFRERQQYRGSGVRPAADVEAEERAKRMTDALLLGVDPEDVEAVQANFFEKRAAREEAASSESVNDESLQQEAERDAAKWEGVQSAIAGDSELASYTEQVNIKVDQKTGKYEGGEFSA